MTEKYFPLHKEENSISYTLYGDICLSDLKLSDDNRPIGRYGRLYLDFLKEQHPHSLQFPSLI